MRIEIKHEKVKKSWSDHFIKQYTARWKDYDFDRSLDADRFDEKGYCNHCWESRDNCECSADTPATVADRIGYGDTPADAVLSLLEGHPGKESWDFSCLGC